MNETNCFETRKVEKLTSRSELIDKENHVEYKNPDNVIEPQIFKTEHSFLKLLFIYKS